MHSDLPATTLRGYVQVNKGTDASGAQHPRAGPDPATSARSSSRTRTARCASSSPTSCRPARRATCSSRSTTSVMGAGEGPDRRQEVHAEPRARSICTAASPRGSATARRTSGSRPPRRVTSYPEGVSVKNVPDMPDPGPGSMTFFYTNQQSARLMFYHDHSFGITRLNVYAGEAAGYMITDDAEKKLIADGTIPAGPDSADHPGQDLRRREHDRDDRPDVELGHRPRRYSAHRATCGCRTSTSRRRTRRCPTASTRPGAGTTVRGSGRRCPDQIAHGPVANPYYDPINAPWEYKDMPALLSRRWAWRRSTTRRWSTAPPTPC